MQTISILYLQLFYKSKTIFKLKVYSYLYIYIYLFLIGGQLLYNIGLVSAIYQQETAIDTHAPPSWIPLPRPTLLRANFHGHYQAEQIIWTFWTNLSWHSLMFFSVWCCYFQTAHYIWWMVSYYLLLGHLCYYIIWNHLQYHFESILNDLVWK